VTPEELIEYYRQLLIAQYANKGNARATIAAFVAEVVANNVIIDTTAGFDLETAVGAQLDLMATYRGCQRSVFGLDVTRKYFSFPDYDVDPDTWPQMGFGTYDDVQTIDAYWLTYELAEAAIYELNDDELRQLIKFRAKVQSSDFSLESIDDILFEFFGEEVELTDNEDMTITYEHFVGDPNNLFDIVVQTNSLPKPAGVTLIIT
jgi:hypothetical protein